MLTSLTRRWRAFRAQPADAGISLTELLVSMGLATMVGGMALVFFVGSNNSTAKASDESFTTGQARVAMSNAIRLLELADTPTTVPGAADSRFDTISATEVIFYSNANANRAASAARTAPVKVDLQITTAGALVLSLYSPISATPSDWTTNYASSPSSVRTLLTGVTNTATATSGFTYCTTSATAGTCTATTSKTAVASVIVTLAVAGGSNEAVQTFTSTATITGVTQ